MLVYNRRGFPTGNVIAEALQTDHDFGFTEVEEFDYLVRWGASRTPEMDEQFDTVINSSEAIRTATNKFLSLEKMNEAGIKVPAYSTDPFELVEEMGYPILGRNLRHARGSDIKLCLQERDFRRRKDFYTAYVPTKREYRVHVVGNEVVRVQGKYLDFPNQQIPWIRNHITGYRFRSPRLRLHSRRLQAAVSAVRATGLDFGAVDLIIGDDNETYILEVNTAPSCSPITAAGYVTGIAKLLSDKHQIEINLDALNLLSSTMEDEDSGDYDDADEEEYTDEVLQEMEVNV